MDSNTKELKAVSELGEMEVVLEAVVEVKGNNATNAKETLYECTICCDDTFILEEMLPAKKCTHEEEVCLKCFDEYISTIMNTKGGGSITEISCPNDKCTHVFSGYDIFSFARNVTSERYANLTLMKKLGNMDDFRWCKAEGCGSGQLHADGDKFPIVECYSCHEKSCYTHDVPWHYGKTCAEFSNEIKPLELSFEEYKKDNAKECPNCGKPIEKNEGCDHLTCETGAGGCGYEFCWICFADYDLIRKNDNSFHDKKCKLHSDNLGNMHTVSSLDKEAIDSAAPLYDTITKYNEDKIGYTKYASVDHLTNQIESNNHQIFGFIELVSQEQARLHFNEKIIDVGSLIELYLKDVRYFGVVKWIGQLEVLEGVVQESNALHGKDTMIAGIELEEDIEGGLNGWHNGSKMFECPEGKGVFLPFTHFRPDQRFEQCIQNVISSPAAPYETSKKVTNTGFENVRHFTSTKNSSNGGEELDFGGIDCPAVPGFQEPIHDFSSLLGRNRGIQGHQNSSYLDATLFAMFSFTSIFDCMLYRPPNIEDIPEYNDVQKVLREEIVNPLRKNLFVRADKLMKFREILDSFTSVTGLMSEEKDPMEILDTLLSQTLKASPFLEISSGQSAYLYQLFVERDMSRTTYPTVQELFEKSFLTSDIKLKKVPPVLILQMPRYRRKFKVFDRILPSQLLDVTDVIEDSPRQCIICGKLAIFECLKCFGDHGTGLDSTAFCNNCCKTVHAHIKRQSHKPKELQVPEEFKAFASSQASTFQPPRLFMELFALLCIETSHYVSFVKCGSSPDSPWCLFDSMAERKEQNGYYIPEVYDADEVSKLLASSGIGLDNELNAIGTSMENKILGELSKRLVCDTYMAFYQSADVMMYQ